MAELSAKKAKKEKKKLAKLEQSADNGVKENTTLEQGLELRGHSDSDKENGVLTKKERKEKKEQKKRERKERQRTEGDVNTNSNVKIAKHRMLEDCSYIEKLMSLVRLKQHNLDHDEEEEEDEEDVVEDVPHHLKLKMRREGDEGRAATHEELKERLRRKMEELRGHSAVTNEARHKRKLKSKLSKLDKSKAGKEELKQKLMKVGKKAGNLNKLKAEVETAGATLVDRPKVKTETGKIVFSKFDFVSDEVPVETAKKKNLDPKAALAKIAKNKERLESMAEKGLTEKVKRIEDKTAWQAVLNKAEGVKVKDDEELLKKSLKRLEQKKKSSKKKWEKRTEEVEKKKTNFQAKRKDNLQKRKKDVKENKKKKSIKKGRLVPGL